MRILYIGGEPIPGQKGGSTHFIEVATSLARLGHEVMVCIPLEEGIPQEEHWHSIRIIRTNMKKKGRTFPILALKQWHTLKCFRPHFIMERYVSFGGVGTLLAKRLSAPLVLEVNSPHAEELIYRKNIKNGLITFLLRWWTRYQFKTATKVLATLESIVPLCAREKFVPVEWAANCTLFNRSKIDPNKLNRIKQSLDITDQPVVVFLGTFRNWHGVSHLPYLIQKVKSKIADVVFVCIGDGDERPVVEEKCKQMNLTDAVRFTGSLQHNDVPAYVSLGTVGIAPYDRSKYPPLEQFGFYWSPLKIFEYMSCEIAVVTIDIPPLNKVISEGINGFVVPEGDWNMFAERIITLLKNQDTCREMGTRARAYVAAHYSWEHHVHNLNNLFLSMNIKDQP